MYKIGEDEMVFCPYNRYHMVSKLRIQKHIIKCKKNYPDMKLATCFYNYTHRLKPEDMLEHYEMCSHKTRLEGSRYYEPYNLTSPKSSVKTDPFTAEFPDINVKPRVFRHPDTFLPSSCQTVDNVGQELVSSGLASESDCPEVEVKKIDAFKTEFSGDHSDDDLEPLPLPKTTSKAFVCLSQNPDAFTPSEPYQLTKFGRRQNLFAHPPPKPIRTAHHLLPDSSTINGGLHSQNKEPRFLSKGSNRTIPPSIFGVCATLKWETLSKGSSASVTSSMFDDSTTLKSEEITFDEDTNEEKTDILDNFNKHVKI